MALCAGAALIGPILAKDSERVCASAPLFLLIPEEIGTSMSVNESDRSSNSSCSLDERFFFSGSPLVDDGEATCLSN